jgi:anti-sigma regulatory factor (Ser/Thr protein kinase)
VGPASRGSRGTAPTRSRAALRAVARRGCIDVATWNGARMNDAQGFSHAAAVVRSDDELLGAATSFVQGGLDAGDLVVIGASPSFTRALAEEFDSGDGVLFDDRIRLNGRRAPDAFGAALGLSRQAAAQGGALRVLAQVDQPDDPRAVREFACFESAANLMTPATQLSALCLYDTRRLPEELVRTAPATHAVLVGSARTWSSAEYGDPRAFVQALPLPREPLQDGTPWLVVDDAPALAGLRHALGAELDRAVPDREQREDLHLGISEMAANAFRHGARPVSARLWAAPDRLVCTISDSGRGIDPLAGYWPAHGQDLSRGGMGLWLARKLFDHVDIIREHGRTTVRLATALHRAA